MENVNLTGHFLIAMPAMSDPYFAKSVTYICEHSENGAIGIVINRPIDMQLDALFEQIDLKLDDPGLSKHSVHFGGPVQTDRGFVLHRPAGEWKSTLKVSPDTSLTTSRDILEAVANGTGPEQLLVSLGYAGWSAGQLEQEMAQNAWLSVKPNSAEDEDKVIFKLPHSEKLNAAMGLLGVDFARLSESAGHA